MDPDDAAEARKVAEDVYEPARGSAFWLGRYEDTRRQAVDIMAPKIAAYAERVRAEAGGVSVSCYDDAVEKLKAAIARAQAAEAKLQEAEAENARLKAELAMQRESGNKWFQRAEKAQQRVEGLEKALARTTAEVIAGALTPEGAKAALAAIFRPEAPTPEVKP